MTKRESGARRRYPPARKRFGQHFLEPAWVERLVDTLDARSTDTFLEIGPGRGALTRPLAARAGRVIAVEVDRDLAAALAAEMPPHVHIVAGDFLRLNLQALLAGERMPVRVVGNLPYNISSPILFRLLDSAGSGRWLSDATLMLQKEVADRLTAAPGTRAYGSLAIQVALRAEVERIMTLPPGAFRPAPKVTSTVVRLRFRPPTVEIGDPSVFERLVRGVFLQRRKTLGNALRPVAAALGANPIELIDKAGLDARSRPESISVEGFARLSRAVL